MWVYRVDRTGADARAYTGWEDYATHAVVSGFRVVGGIAGFGPE